MDYDYLDRHHWRPHRRHQALTTRTYPLGLLSDAVKCRGHRSVNGGISARYDEHRGNYFAYIQLMGYPAELLEGFAYRV